MRRYILRRLGQAVLVVVGVSLVVFCVIRLTGDPAYLMLPPDATEADRLRFTRELTISAVTRTACGLASGPASGRPRPSPILDVQRRTPPVGGPAGLRPSDGLRPAGAARSSATARRGLSMKLDAFTGTLALQGP